LSAITSTKLLLMCTIHVSSPDLCMTAYTNLSLHWLTFLADAVTFTSHHFVSFPMPHFKSKAPLHSAPFHWASQITWDD
jgi:hypothetical protein